MHSHLKKKNRSVLAGVVPPQLGQRRTKSGSKLLEDSGKIGKRNNSLRTENMMKQLSNISTASVHQTGDSNDRFKNYKAGKLSQEIYNKTLKLAGNTLDRYDLNRSINKKHAEPLSRDKLMNTSQGSIVSTSFNERPKFGVLGNRTDDSGKVTSVGKSEDKRSLIPKSSPMVIHKRNNTIGDIISKQTEIKKQGNLSFGTGALSKQGPMSQTQPIYGMRQKMPESGSAQQNDLSGSLKPSNSRPNTANTKDKKSSSFYHDRRGVIPGSSKDMDGGALNTSIDSKKSKLSKCSENSKKRPPSQKTYHFIESIKRLEPQLPPFEQSKTVVKDFDTIRAFSVNTHQGTVRAYNEDRVSILLNAQQRFENLVASKIKSCSMFAIYDGHGGSDCCNFLKENLHSYVLSTYNAKDLRGSIKASCQKLDTDYFKKARTDYYCDTSGSCALALLVIGRCLFTQTHLLSSLMSAIAGASCQRITEASS